MRNLTITKGPEAEKSPLTISSSFAAIGSDGELKIALGIDPLSVMAGTEMLQAELTVSSHKWSHKSISSLQLLPELESLSAYPQLLWASASIPAPSLRFRDYEITIDLANQKATAKKKAGVRDRECLWRLVRALAPRVWESVNSLWTHFLLNKQKPLLILHCWHKEAALKILGMVPYPECWGGVTILAPSNADQAVTEGIVEFAKQQRFPFVEVIEVPAKGRDIGGLVSILMESCHGADRNRLYSPHLFLHTKKSAHLPEIISTWWRESLIGRILLGAGLPLALTRMSLWNAGIVYSRDAHRQENRACENTLPARSASQAQLLAEELFDFIPDTFSFCAGTMMWFVPARIATCWTKQRLNRVLELLEPSKDLCEPSYAHAFERLFPEALRRTGVEVVSL